MYETFVTICTEDNEGFCHDFDYLVKTKSNPEDLDLFSWIMNDFVMPDNNTLHSVRISYRPQVLEFNF